MILDERTEFFDAVNCQNEAGSDLIGDVIDLGIANRDPGNGQPLYLVIVVDTAADGGAGTNGTTAFQLASDSIAAVAVDGSQTIHFTSKPHVLTDLTAGATFVFPLPVSGLDYERYLGVQTVQAVEGEDALVASAFLTLDPTGWRAMADAAN
jgi:hypothetical protein